MWVTGSRDLQDCVLSGTVTPAESDGVKEKDSTLL